MAHRNQPEEELIDQQAGDQPEQTAAQTAAEVNTKAPADKPAVTSAAVEPPVDASDKPASDADSDAESDDTDDQPDKTPAEEPKFNEDDPAVIIHSGRQHRFRHWLADHKKVIIPAVSIVVVIAVLAGVPMTRYAIAGLVVKQRYSVVVVDTQTGKPVSSAAVGLKGKSTQTDSQGRATLTIPVGKGTLNLEKRYYKTSSQNILVPLRKPALHRISFAATGRQVPVTVMNKISGKPLGNATVAAKNTQVITDKNGEATIVLPADATTAQGTVSADNYNKLNITIKVTAAKDAANTFQATPAGKIYFLSNAAGTVDVVKTDLDGQNRQTVLKGTGKEDVSNTVLLAAQNWKYLALQSKRDGGANAKVFLIDTSNDALTTMDEGDADFQLIGWSSHTFIYRVDRHNKQSWDTKAQALKAYDASTKKLITLDETTSTGSSYADYTSERYTSTFILDNEIVFGKTLSTANSVQAAQPHQATITSVRPDGSNKHVIKSWASSSSLTYVDAELQPYAPNEIYFSSANAEPDHLYEYEDGQVKTVDGKKASDIWNNGQYFTYLFSPSNKLTFWSEPRDGKNTLFTGDADANSKKQIATLSEYQTFGWYTDDYLLVSKSGSELYIMPTAGLVTGKQALKITDYFKPTFSAPGYGKGYGGF